MKVIENENLNCLIVDDEPFNLIALEGLLEQMNIQNIKKAYNGQIALEILEKEPNFYDVIFSDYQMPVMNGYELAHQVKTMQAQGIIQ